MSDTVSDSQKHPGGPWQPGHPKWGGRQPGTTNNKVALRRERLAEAERVANEHIGDFDGTAHEFLCLLFRSGSVPISIRTDAAKVVHATERAKLQAIAVVDSTNLPTFLIRDVRNELKQLELQTDSVQDAVYSEVADSEDAHNED